MDTRGKGRPEAGQRHMTLPKSYGVVLRRINSQIGHNLAKWGDDKELLILLPVLMEEVGEIARGVLEYSAVDLTESPLRKGAEAHKAAQEAIQAAAVCVELAKVLDEMADECKARMPK